MNFDLKPLKWADLAQKPLDTLLVLAGPVRQSGRDALSQWIAQAIDSGDLDAKTGAWLTGWRPAALAARRVLLVRAGDGMIRDVRKAIAAIMPALKAAPPGKLAVVMADGGWPPGTLRAAMLAVAEGTYVYATTVSKPTQRCVNALELWAASPAACKREFAHARAEIAGIECAKEWANRPANHATPTQLAKAAQALAKTTPRLQTEVLDAKDVARLGMGAFLAVARGSEEPLRFIVMRYNGAARTQAPVVLVGKGITFDTGGISLKPAAEMDEMKFDMSGAASVLGVLTALAQLKPAINVVGLIPACENMPDGRATKPGDVVKSLSGQTIEVLNTDAEGRLILSDALTYAARFKPSAVIDIATLTGACVIALGGVRSGLFSTSDALAHALQCAGDASGDLCWRMPLDDDYAEGLKTSFADVANVAGRAGGAVTAAKFLQRFCDKFPWAHLDIAGTGWKSGAHKSATGRPVGLLLHYLLAQASAAPTSKTTKG